MKPEFLWVIIYYPTRLASPHLVLFQNGDPCPPNILAHLAWVARAGLWPGGKVRPPPVQCREGGWAVSGPAASSQSPRAEREQRGDSYQFRVSWAGLEDWGVWPVTGHQWPPVSSSDQQPLQPQGVTSDRDRPALRSPGREASHPATEMSAPSGSGSPKPALKVSRGIMVSGSGQGELWGQSWRSEPSEGTLPTNCHTCNAFES